MYLCGLIRILNLIGNSFFLTKTFGGLSFALSLSFSQTFYRFEKERR